LTSKMVNKGLSKMAMLELNRIMAPVNLNYRKLQNFNSIKQLIKLDLVHACSVMLKINTCKTSLYHVVTMAIAPNV